MGAPTPEQLAALEAAGVYDPDAPGADDTLAVVGYLLGRGATVDDLIAGHAQNRLHAAAGDRILRRGEDRVGLDEIARLAGVDPGRIVDIWRASGFPEPPPDARTWGPSDAAMFQLFEAGAAFLGDEVGAQFTRVLGTSMSRIADAAVALFLANVEQPIVAEPASGPVLAEAVTEGMALLDALPVVLDSLFRHHVELAARRAMSAWDREHPTAVHCVGFVDLVGSTRLLGELDAPALAHLMSDFEATAADLVSGHGCRLVKAIGDEVMFYAVDPAVACAIALDLLAAVDAHPDLPAARAGLSVGPVVWQDGDCYGPVVNLAARLVDDAAPGEALVDAAVAEAVADDPTLRVDPLGDRSLRGFDAPVAVHRLRRGAD